MFKWVKGRLGTGYEKLCLCSLLFFDVYLIRFPEGSNINTHIDTVPRGRHFRLNIVLRKCKKGGEFICLNALINTPRIKLFRPDVQEHSVTTVLEGSRFILSIGWICP